MMIHTKMENFRLSVRKQYLEKTFDQIRSIVIRRGEQTPMIQKFQRLVKNYQFDLDELQASIPIFESTTDEELLVLILMYIEKFDLKELAINIPEILINKLMSTNLNRLQFYLIASITNMITVEDSSIWEFFAQRNILFILVEILQNFHEKEIIPNMLECVSLWPYEFLKMNKIQDQIEFLLTIQKYSDCDIYYFYKILTKMTEEINKEYRIFLALVEHKFIQNAIEDFNKKQYYIVDFFINLSFLDNDILNPLINFNFLSAIVFELNKPNKIQSSLFQLIRNLLLTDYSIRMLLYNFSIFSHLCYGIEYSILNMDLNSLEEILTCLKILFQEEEMGYANHRKSILDSEIESQIQQIFNYSPLYNQDIFTLAAEVLALLYVHFPFNRNQELVEKLNQHSNLIDTEIYESLMNCIYYYEQ